MLMVKALCYCETRDDSFSLLNKNKQELDPVRPGKTSVICKSECVSCDQAAYSLPHTLGLYQEQAEAPKQTALKDL